MAANFRLEPLKKVVVPQRTLEYRKGKCGREGEKNESGYEVPQIAKFRSGMKRKDPYLLRDQTISPHNASLQKDSTHDRAGLHFTYKL